MKELEKIFEDCDESGGREMLFTLSDHDYIEVKDLFIALEKERDYSKAMLIDQIKKKKGISKRYGDLLKELQTLKDAVKEFEEQSRHGWETEEAHDEALDKLKKLTRP